jgi:guanyl-specific ribonuclease Sa
MERTGKQVPNDIEMDLYAYTGWSRRAMAARQTVEFGLLIAQLVETVIGLAATLGFLRPPSVRGSANGIPTNSASGEFLAKPAPKPRAPSARPATASKPLLSQQPGTPAGETLSPVSPTAPTSEEPWMLFSRSRAEADAFRLTVRQIEGLELPPPPNLGGPFPTGSPGKWGSTFNNTPLQPGRARELPGAFAPFREYTTLMPGATNRGPLRAVSGDQGRALFNTWTHYGQAQPFFPIDPTQPLPRLTFLRFR